MRLSTKSQHAVTAMLNLALHENEGPVTIADISDSQHISLSYLEQIFARLRKHGLVKGMRGPGGGYRLARATDEISVAEIIAAVEDHFARPSAPSPHHASLYLGHQQRSRELWNNVSRKIYDFLDTITLEDVMVEPEALDIVTGSTSTSAGRFAA